MSEVSREQVLAIAALARLRITDEEAATYAAQLSAILDHVEALDAVDVEPSDHDTTPGAGALRPDSPSADPLHIPPPAFAPAWADGFFTVPRLAAMEADSDQPRD